MTGWIARLPCTRSEADAAVGLDDPFADTQPPPTLAAAETDTGWELHLYTADAPETDLLHRFAALAPSADAAIRFEPLPDADWVLLSQAGLEPVNAGRFHIHTGDHAGRHRPGQWPMRIDAGLAFGTGQHATTHGCLLMLQRVARRARPRAVLDVGTGTGVLALACERLFPLALLMAADVDARATKVARGNARINGVPLGRIRFATAFGVGHPAIASQAPYDLVLANILAGPLVRMATSLAGMVSRGGHLLLAGLLAEQQQRVLAVYRAHGFRLVHATTGTIWPVLWLRRQKAPAPRAALRRARRGTAAEARRADSI